MLPSSLHNCRNRSWALLHVWHFKKWASKWFLYSCLPCVQYNNGHHHGLDSKLTLVYLLDWRVLGWLCRICMKWHDSYILHAVLMGLFCFDKTLHMLEKMFRHSIGIWNLIWPELQTKMRFFAKTCIFPISKHVGFIEILLAKPNPTQKSIYRKNWSWFLEISAEAESILDYQRHHYVNSFHLLCQLLD